MPDTRRAAAKAVDRGVLCGGLAGGGGRTRTVPAREPLTRLRATGESRTVGGVAAAAGKAGEGH